MKWFKHMATSWDDEKLAKLVGKGGFEGLALYGVYWRVLEIVSAQIPTGSQNCAVNYTISRWSLLLSLRGSHVRSTLLRLGLTGVLTVECTETDIKVTVPNLLKYRDEYSRKSGHNQKSIPPRTEIELDGEIEAEKESKKKKPSRAKARGDKGSPAEADLRFLPFKNEFFAYTQATTHGDPPWDAVEATRLSSFLASSPKITVEQWQTILTHRSRSEVSHGEPLSKWIRDARKFFMSPIDRFGKPTAPINSAAPIKTASEKYFEQLGTP